MVATSRTTARPILERRYESIGLMRVLRIEAVNLKSLSTFREPKRYKLCSAVTSLPRTPYGGCPTENGNSLTLNSDRETYCYDSYNEASFRVSDVKNESNPCKMLGTRLRAFHANLVTPVQ